MKVWMLILSFFLSGLAWAEGRVFVLGVASAESFDRSLPTLRFAAHDLARMQHVLKRMASVDDDHMLLVSDASRRTLRKAFATLHDQILAAGRSQETKFIFYYTGHSDIKGLHLADGLLGKDELNALLAAVPAHSRIAILDSCYSGALAGKGIKPAAEFVIPRAEYDEPSGSVFLAATSATDIAFELEELSGSLFTHHVVAGLYGAADANHDGLVTVDELYQYVYQQMNASALSLPRGGQQIPEYAMRLQGKGALVLAEVQRSTVALQVAADLSGRLTLATDGGLQIFRATKQEGRPLSMPLVPGEYRVTLEQEDNIGRGLLRIQAGSSARLDRRDLIFEKAPRLALVAKGERSRPRLAMAVGLTHSTYARSGPRLEAELASRSALIESIDCRFFINGGAQQNRLDYRQQTGTSEALSLLTGMRGSFWPALALDGQDWRLLLAGGFDYVWQHWEPLPPGSGRRFRNFVPKVAYGIGTSFTQASGFSWGLHFRREFPFATAVDNGDVLALGASVFAASVEW